MIIGSYGSGLTRSKSDRRKKLYLDPTLQKITGSGTVLIFFSLSQAIFIDKLLKIEEFEIILLSFEFILTNIGSERENGSGSMFEIRIRNLLAGCETSQEWSRRLSTFVLSILKKNMKSIREAVKKVPPL